MSEEPSIERLYSDPNITETTIHVLGVPINVRILSAEEYLEVITVSGDTSKPENRKEYLKRLVDSMIIEPKVEFERLSPAATILLLAQLENALGLTPEAIKGFL
jgi:hypothetical protein